MQTEVKPGDGRWMRLLPFVLVAPGLALVLLLFLYPLLRLVGSSLLEPTPGFENYVAVVTDPTLWQIIKTTLIISAQCTVVTLVLAYPVSYLLSRVPRARANLLMMFVLLPFWTSLLVRMYAWMALLGRHGIINEAVTDMGLTTTPYPLLYNRFAVIVGMSHFLLPFMILSLYSTMIGIDHSLIEAANSMGSRFRQTFLRVYLPLSLPGVYAGCLLVFILAMGFYITPALLGSPQETTISVYIQQQIEELNWGEGTAMAVILVAIVVALFIVYDRLLGFDRLFRDVRAR
jgi:ABC-type spermidine/putrescine transport system permease subunit I